MSADNGIYILQCKDQYRVLHTQAIENLYFTYENGNYQELFDPVPTRIIEHYGNCKYTRNKDTALKIAHSMLIKLPVCEYGIQIIPVNKTWEQIIGEAKEIAEKEIGYLKASIENYNTDHDKYALELLQNSLRTINQKEFERKNLQIEYYTYLCRYGIDDLEGQTENPTMSFREFVKSKRNQEKVSA